MAGFFSKANDVNNDNNNVAITENGAIGYRSTGKSLLDLNFSIPYLRDKNEYDIINNYWIPAYNENQELAMRWLFFLRDIREGLGERRIFRVIMNWMANNYPKEIKKLISGNKESDENIGEIIPFYGRWDDLIYLMDNDYVSKNVYNTIKKQLSLDIENMNNNKSVSLIAKWLPSLTTSKKTNKRARKICKKIGLYETDYRKKLSALRRYLNVTEVHMSNRDWDSIEYEKVPSRASMIYSSAFIRHDGDRYLNFISNVNKGNFKINSNTIYPHEIVNRIKNTFYNYTENDNIDVFEGLWKNLPNKINSELNNTIVVRDGSGSMISRINNYNNITSLDIADAISIYFAERLSGEFNNKIITFSNRPKFIEFDDRHKTLLSKLSYIEEFDEISNTNIEAVFNLILQTAIKHKMKQDEIPSNILIISDMEFDECTEVNMNKFDKPHLFECIKREFESYGYKLPRLIFWNVCSRTNVIPIVENELGVCLVSGFSINILNIIMSGKLDPYECLIEYINSSRYDPISIALGYNK